MIPWEKQPHFSTAGYAPVPAFIADRHLWRVPHQPAEPSPGQPLLFGGGRDLAQKERAAADLLPRQAPGLSAGGKDHHNLLLDILFLVVHGDIHRNGSDDKIPNMT